MAESSSESAFQPKKLSFSVMSADCSGNCEDLACRLRVPNRLLLEWHGEAASGSSYIELLNEPIANNIVMVDIHCERLVRRIARRAGTIRRSAAKLRGAARIKQLDEWSSFDVMSGETVSALRVMSDLEETLEEVKD